MKLVAAIGVPILVLTVLAIGLTVAGSRGTAFAAKPQKVIEMSNGYPSEFTST